MSVDVETLIKEWKGRSLDRGYGDIEVERGHILHWLEATENRNPIYWDDRVAAELAGGPIAPPSMVSVWMRPLVWHPDRTETRRPLELHFALKEALGLPEGVVTGNEIVFHNAVRNGDRIASKETIRDIGELRSNRLGTGRFWTIDVTHTNQRSEIVAVETYYFFGYRGKSS